MNPRSTSLSTSDARREVVIDSAVDVFAGAGYLGTPVASVAARANISPAYVFKLFPSKESLFLAALARCYERIEEALERGASESADHSPEGVLDAMGDAYAHLIADRSLLMLQVHAQSASSVPEIAAGLRAGIQRIAVYVKSRSGAPDAAVQRFIAYGQLCHLVTTIGIDGDDSPWARLVAAGIRHY